MPNTLDHLEKRIYNSAVNLAHGLNNIVGFDDVLPIGDISVKKTADGVNVKFIQKPNAASKTIKDVDES